MIWQSYFSIQLLYAVWKWYADTQNWHLKKLQVSIHKKIGLHSWHWIQLCTWCTLCSPKCEFLVRKFGPIISCWKYLSWKVYKGNNCLCSSGYRRKNPKVPLSCPRYGDSYYNSTSFLNLLLQFYIKWNLRKLTSKRKPIPALQDRWLRMSVKRSKYK